MNKHIFSLFALFALPACALSPVDKQTVANVSTPVQFYGGTTPVGSMPVEIQALNPSGQWTTIDTAQSGASPYRINFKAPNYVDLYFYNVTQVIPSAYWTAGIVGKKAQVRALSLSVPLITLDSNSLSCLGGATDLTYFVNNCKNPHSPVTKVFTSDYAGVDRGCTEDGIALAAAVNLYRINHSLQAIPFSPSLCAVAQAHVVDLAVNHPQTNGCNLHSWSAAGSWSSCCYTADHAQAACMWNKPGQLTSYGYPGYEIAASGVSTAAGAVAQWQASSAHNAVILNQGQWSNQWKAIGAAMYQGYAVVWFGNYPDTATP